MRRLSVVLLFVFALLSLGASRPVRQQGTNDAYEQIQNRNIFGLRQPETPPPQAAKPPDAPKLTLTGITTILGNKRALLKASMPGAAQGKAAEERSFILTEGQQEAFLEILEINESAGWVRLRNSGVEMTVSFERNGPSLPTMASGIPAPAQGSPGQMAANQQPSAGQTAQLPPGMRTIPRRNYRTAAPNAGDTNAVSAAGSGIPVPSATGYQNRTNRVYPSAPGLPEAATADSQQVPSQYPPTSPVTGLTPEQRLLLLEIQREAIRQEAAEPPYEEAAPPLPPGTPQGGPLWPQ